MSYVGNTPTTQSFISGTDYFNGDGSTVAFTLSRTVVSPNDVEAVINNVVQQPNSAYTISGTTITFTSAPSAGTSNIYVRYLSTTTQSITPSQNTVSYSTLNSDTQSKLGIMYKNRIINGAMVIDQRNAGASVSVSSNTYTLDRYRNLASGGGVYSVQQSSTAPAGFTKSLLMTVTTTAASPAAGNYYSLRQSIEGYNIADLGWGTANAKTVTLSFWVRSSLTGTFGGAVNNDADASYAFSYTINTANTWEQKTVTIPGATVGTWATDNSLGLNLELALGVGSTRSGTAGTWTYPAAVLISVTGATNVMATNGATLYLTGVQLEVGTQATTFTNAGGSYGGELALCQRYYEKSYDYATVPGTGAPNGAYWQTGSADSAGNAYANIRYAVAKRTAPTMTGYRYDTGAQGNWGYEKSGSSGTNTINFDALATSACRGYVNNGSSAYVGTTIFGQWTASAEL